MSPSNERDMLLARLESKDARCRDVAAAEIGDLMEADYLTKRDYRKAVKSLIAAIERETDLDAKESMFNALSFASSSDNAAAINWDPIADRLDALDVACLEHALIILGDSGNAKYKPLLKRFLDHGNEVIASTAADALKTLDWQQQRLASHAQVRTRNR